MFGTTHSTFSSIIFGIVEVMNSLVWLLSGIAILIFFWGLVRYISNSSGPKGQQEGRQLIVWGLISLFIIFSLGGILKLMCISFLGNANCTNPKPNPAINDTGDKNIPLFIQSA